MQRYRQGAIVTAHWERFTRTNIRAAYVNNDGTWIGGVEKNNRSSKLFTPWVSISIGGFWSGDLNPVGIGFGVETIEEGMAMVEEFWHVRGTCKVQS